MPPTLIDLLPPVSTRLIEVGRPVCTPVVQPKTMNHFMDTAEPRTCTPSVQPTFTQTCGPVPMQTTGDPLYHTNPLHVTPAVTTSFTGVHTPVTSNVDDGENLNHTLAR